MPSRTASSYFVAFSDFVPHPSASIEQEFSRLATYRQWSPGSKRYKKERRKFLLSEYDHHVGYIQTANDVSQWQDLCRELGIDNPPQSIKDCKKALQKVHVNLVDLLNSRRQGSRVSTFHSEKALREYSIKRKKIFPKDEAKRDKLLKILLREIFV